MYSLTVLAKSHRNAAWRYALADRNRYIASGASIKNLTAAAAGSCSVMTLPSVSVLASGLFPRDAGYLFPFDDLITSASSFS